MACMALVGAAGAQEEAFMRAARQLGQREGEFARAAQDLLTDRRTAEAWEFRRRHTLMRKLRRRLEISKVRPFPPLPPLDNEES